MQRRLGKLLPLCLVVAACGPRFRPGGPTDDVDAPARGEVKSGPPTLESPPSREILVGEMCPKAAGDRPAVKPIIVRHVSWEDSTESVTRPIEANEARQFSVLGWDGRRVGLMSVAGATETAGHGSVATGSYAGDSPCQLPTESKAKPDSANFDPACVKALDHCGLAVALLAPSAGPEARPFDETPEPIALDTGGACAAGEKLIVDIDGDGKTEAFTLAELLDELRAPSDELTAVDLGDGKCDARFAVHAIIPAGDPRDWRGLDLLGVLDLDGDGRRELIFAYHYSDRSTWAVYSARGTTARLDLVGEGIPW